MTQHIIKAKNKLFTFLAIMGPGLIVMGADNDSGGLATYVQAGAQHGLNLVWLLLLLLPITYLVQEMVARLGIATGQGHAKMIQSRFGKMWGAFSHFDLQLINFLTLITEFAAISMVLTQLGVSPYLGVPLVAGGLIFMTCASDYLRWERIAIGLCLLNLFWFAAVFIVKPDLSQVASHAVPHFTGATSSLVFLMIAMVGTTIAPWQLFFQQSCVADKGLSAADLKMARIDTFVGAVFTTLISLAMLLIGDAAYRHGISFDNPAQMVKALGPIYGTVLYHGVLMMMVNAAVLGAAAISMSSAWAYSEIKGLGGSLKLKFKEAPRFYLTYAACVAAAAFVVLIPQLPLQLIVISVQVLAGIMLPSALLILQLLANDKKMLGAEFVNRPWNNVVNWIIIAILFGLSNMLAIQALFPALFGGSK